jgi:hypothetical protein
MSEAVRVVAHYVDGRILKGTTQDFRPNRPTFHLVPASGKAIVDVRCADLKAVFFVKTFEGSATRTKLRGFVQAPSETTQGKKIAVRFKDGELICGYTLAYTPERSGFFLVPADPKSNNLRVYVVTASAVEVKAGPAADALARKVLVAKA